MTGCSIRKIPGLSVGVGTVAQNHAEQLLARPLVLGAALHLPCGTHAGTARQKRQYPILTRYVKSRGIWVSSASQVFWLEDKIEDAAPLVPSKCTPLNTMRVNH